MKRVLHCAAVLVILLPAISDESQAQWVQTTGPSYGYIYGVAMIGTNLFAGSSDGTFLSSSSGTSWTLVGGGGILTVSGTNLILGGSGGLFLSTNNGTIWTQVYVIPPGIFGPTATFNCFAVSGTSILAG